MEQETVLRALRNEIERLQKQQNKALRVAINGIEGVGKTTFASHLCRFLQVNNFEAIHVSIDGFHYDKTHRYRQGRNSAKGYYQDSYNELAFVNKVLLSSQKTPPHYWEATHDLETDEYLDLRPISISDKTILITDGAYLFKPNYLPHWDLKIYLQADFETARRRGVDRDQKALGGIEPATEKFLKRYHAASQLYIEECKPESVADFLIDATSFDDFKIIKK